MTTNPSCKPCLLCLILLTLFLFFFDSVSYANSQPFWNEQREIPGIDKPIDLELKNEPEKSAFEKIPPESITVKKVDSPQKSVRDNDVFRKGPLFYIGLGIMSLGSFLFLFGIIVRIRERGKGKKGKFTI